MEHHKDSLGEPAHNIIELSFDLLLEANQLTNMPEAQKEKKGNLKRSSPKPNHPTPAVQHPPSPGAMSSLLPILLLCSSLLIATTDAGDPIFIDSPSNTNYTRGSAFGANLDAHLSSLPATADASSGFAVNVTGAAPDKVYGLAQCRADVNEPECRASPDYSARDMADMCPGQKNAMLIYDSCLLRHSNASFFGAVDTSVVKYWWNPQNATQQELFTSRLGGLMGNLTAKAAYVSPPMFAAAEVSVTPFVNMGHGAVHAGPQQCRLNPLPRHRRHVHTKMLRWEAGRPGHLPDLLHPVRGVPVLQRPGR
ncbi:hypothetical protein ACP70R_039703 [Stipagrostis hirtigluma subsp. patula]